MLTGETTRNLVGGCTRQSARAQALERAGSNPSPHTRQPGMAAAHASLPREFAGFRFAAALAEVGGLE